MKTKIVWLGAATAFLAGPAPAQTTLPQFQADPFWRKPLPNNWVLGQISGIAAGKYDRIWVVHRPGSHVMCRSRTYDTAGRRMTVTRSASMRRGLEYVILLT